MDPIIMLIEPNLFSATAALAVALIAIGLHFRQYVILIGGGVSSLILGLLSIKNGVGQNAATFTNTTIFNITDPVNFTTVAEKFINTTSNTSFTITPELTNPLGVILILIGVGVIVGETVLVMLREDGGN